MNSAASRSYQAIHLRYSPRPGSLFLLGSQADQSHIRDTTLALVDLVPNARLCELPAQGHMAQMLARHLVATEITAFLNPMAEPT